MLVHRLAAWLGLGVAGALGGCSNKADQAPSEGRSFEPLVSISAWSSLSRADDPFVTDSSAPPACVGPGFVVESDPKWLEIDTGLCGWVTLTAMARSAGTVRETLQL